MEKLFDEFYIFFFLKRIVPKNTRQFKIFVSKLKKTYKLLTYFNVILSQVVQFPR